MRKSDEIYLQDCKINKVRASRRSSSIDESQLLNARVYDMSLIGPRPLLAEYSSFYSPRQMERHKVK